MRALLLFAALTLTAQALTANAQWDIQTPATTADLRGIDNVGKGIAWASGTNGTVLRTEDAGYLWQHCTTPPGADHLDFRGIQAFDANTAIVMSSGKGDQSRLYKTTDGCQTWQLVFTNPDKDGFWDAIQAHIADPSVEPGCPSKTPVISGAILGDPAVHKSNQWDTSTRPSFYLATFLLNSSCSQDRRNPSAVNLFSRPDEAAFAASNSVLLQVGPHIFWVGTEREIIQYEYGTTSPSHDYFASVCPIDVPLQRGLTSQGMFSFAVRPGSIELSKLMRVYHNFHCLKADIVAVGGDYSMPNDSEKTAAFTAGGNKFKAASTPPHG